MKEDKAKKEQRKEERKVGVREGENEIGGRKINKYSLTSYFRNSCIKNNKDVSKVLVKKVHYDITANMGNGLKVQE